MCVYIYVQPLPSKVFVQCILNRKIFDFDIDPASALGYFHVHL